MSYTDKLYYLEPGKCLKYPTKVPAGYTHVYLDSKTKIVVFFYRQGLVLYKNQMAYNIWQQEIKNAAKYRETKIEELLSHRNEEVRNWAKEKLK